jgi:hypothetical protein
MLDIFNNFFAFALIESINNRKDSNLGRLQNKKEKEK